MDSMKRKKRRARKLYLSSNGSRNQDDLTWNACGSYEYRICMQVGR